MDNPLLREPLRPEHVKPRLLGHWGTTPGLNFIYAHLNRAITPRDLDMIYVIGPGHGGPGLVASAYLEGTYTETYPDITLDEEGMQRLFKQFSFPGGIPSHVAPETPGSIHEGGELGYSLSHAYGAAFDNPDLVVARRRRRRRGRDRPARDELAQHQVRRPGPRRRGAADPAPQRLQDRQPDRSWRGSPTRSSTRCSAATATRRTSSSGDDPETMHQAFAATLDGCLDEIRDIQERARDGGLDGAPVLADDRAPQPQGLDRPEGGRRREDRGLLALPPGAVRRRPRQRRATARILEEWMRSYRPEELFDANGAPGARPSSTSTRRASAG